MRSVQRDGKAHQEFAFASIKPLNIPSTKLLMGRAPLEPRMLVRHFLAVNGWAFPARISRSLLSKILFDVSVQRVYWENICQVLSVGHHDFKA